MTSPVWRQLAGCGDNSAGYHHTGPTCVQALQSIRSRDSVRCIQVHLLDFVRGSNPL